MVVPTIRSKVIDDIAYSIVDMYLKKHSFAVLDNRLLSNLKGELDAVNVLRDIWLDQMGGSPERLIEFYEKTNDQNGTQHYENLIDTTVMTFVAEFFAALLAGIILEEYPNRDKILDRIRRLYRKPALKILEETDSITSKYDKALRYLFQVYALKEYSERKHLSLAEFIRMREDIRANVYSDQEKTLPEGFVLFYNVFLETHLLPNLEQNYAQEMGVEFVTLSQDRNFNDYISAMSSEKTQDSLHETTIINTLLQKVLQGISAGKRGTAIGNVAIVIDEDDCKGVKKGNVMVVDEMCPDFIPAARRAIALISNKGGVTSHTAIIGRALNIPTVVGTEKATKDLKNGLEVMVDSRQGIVFTVIKDF